MKNKTDFITITQSIVHIYDEIKEEGTHLKKKYILAWITSVVNIASIIVLIYLTWNKSINSNTFSLLIGVINILIISLFVVFIQRENNKLYRYYNIELEKPVWRSFQTIAQLRYQQIFTDKFENKLLSTNLLFDCYGDIRLIDSYINVFRRMIKEKYVEPLIMTGRISILVFLLNQGVNFVNTFDIGKINIKEGLLLLVLLLFLIMVSYIGLVVLGKFYMQIKNRKLDKYSRICDYLEAIRLKRIFEDIEMKRNAPPTIFQRIKKIFD